MQNCSWAITHVMALPKNKHTALRVTNLQTLWNSLTIRGIPTHVKWYSYHASTNWMLLNTHMDENMQLTTEFLTTFPGQDFSLTFPRLFVKSLAVPDISRFSDKWSPWSLQEPIRYRVTIVSEGGTIDQQHNVQHVKNIIHTIAWSNSVWRSAAHFTKRPTTKANRASEIISDWWTFRKTPR